MSDSVIKVENVSKAYRLGQIGGGTLKEDFARYWAKLRGKPDPFLKIGEERKAEVRRRKSEVRSQTSDLRSPHSDIFWALDNVSFEVRQGEVLGIIGRNGAGKSTLLKILSQVTTPTSGQIKIKGRIASLLEVGTGFNPEMTGRENVFLNGAILGMTKAEIRGKFDEIVAFSEIEEFIDTPVKRYSSGMYVRLAFAVAAHLEPEILICDEVLAVGDAEFQKKCLGKMQDVSRGGRTVLFVSHNTGAVANLCSKVLFLKHGRVNDFGTTTTILDKYLSDSVKVGSNADLNSHRTIKPTGTRIIAISVSGKNESRVSWGEPIRLTIEVETRDKIEGLFFGITIINQKGETVGSCLLPDRFALKANEKARYLLAIATENLTPATYALNVGMGRGGLQEILDAVAGYPTFEVAPTSETGAGIEIWDSSWGSISFREIQFERILP